MINTSLNIVNGLNVIIGVGDKTGVLYSNEVEVPFVYPENGLDPSQVVNFCACALALADMDLKVVVVTNSNYILREFYMHPPRMSRYFNLDYHGTVITGDTIDDVGDIPWLNADMDQSSAYIDFEVKAGS